MISAFHHGNGLLPILRLTNHNVVSLRTHATKMLHLEEGRQPH